MDAVGCGTFYLASLSAYWSLIFCKFLVRVSHSLHSSGSGLGDIKKMEEEAEVVDAEENIPRKMKRLGKRKH
jgi:hypothetical protein